MTTETEMKPAEKIESTAASLGLTMEAVFVPWSQSRAKDEKQPSLNWRVTIKRNGREILTTDYGAGCGHAPSYKQQWGKRTMEDLDRDLKVAWECENGFPAAGIRDGGTNRVFGPRVKDKAIMPNLADVLASLAMDSDVLYAGGFESWAGDLGYDVDSRKAESIYRAYLDIALNLRSSLGEDGLQRLREVCHDY